MKNKIEWTYKIPLFSTYVLKGVLIVFLFPAITLLTIFFLIGAFNGLTFSNLTPDIYYAGFFVGTLALTTFIVLVIFFHDGFETRYKINKDGVEQISGSRVKKMNRLTTVAGILGKSATTTGAGLIASSGEDRFISWKEAKVINIDNQKRYIYVSREKIAIEPIGIFCTKENFKEVLRLINLYKSI